jgi:hypothetical protein
MVRDGGATTTRAARWRQPKQTVEVTVGEFGLSRWWATATTTRTTSRQ